ncbi:hypothetical protein MKX03_023689 [Papaver bracteatum]|nr:hypothetical protein MKX03_023689 [Papaver bracteatum]
MDSEAHRSVSLRETRRADRNNTQSHIDKVAFSPLVRTPQDYPFKIVWRKGFIRLVLVAGILWVLIILTVLMFHVWSCQTSITFLSAICNREGKFMLVLNSLGFTPKPLPRCTIPVANDPDSIVIPEKRTPDKFVENLSYILEDDDSSTSGSQSAPLFGGHQSWAQREQSFKLNSSMKVHCGFIRNGGAEMEPADVKYAKKCRFVVASAIFDGYDTPHQPSNISRRSQKLFCFLMAVDQQSLDFIKENVTVRDDGRGGKWVGIWRLVLLKTPPYDEPRRNGKVPKILTHRLFPQAEYSIWVDGKMELIVDPLLILERYLWRDKSTFAIARHKHHQSICEEADAIKRRKGGPRPLIDLHAKIYVYEGMEPWSVKKKTVSGKAKLILLPMCQLSFGYVVYRLGSAFKFYMFPNCEYNSLFVLHSHTREHSSAVEWVKSLDEFKHNSTLKESRGGLGLWMPYPGDLDSVSLPPVTRTSQAG